jgi:hypothetical protein
MHERDAFYIGLSDSRNQSNLLQNINLTAQQLAVSGLSGARLRLGLPIMNGSTNSNSIDRVKNKLQVSDYLNAYRLSNQASPSNQISNGIVAPTATEAAMIAEIERLREQNQAQLMSLVRSGLLSSTSIGGGNIDLTRSRAANCNVISDLVSRINASATQPLMTNVAMACLNRNTDGFNVSSGGIDTDQASKFNHSH